MQKKYFVYVYRPGPAWVEGKPVTEQPLSEHFDYMTELQHARNLIIGGPFKDATGAMGIIEAESLEAATEIVDRDPVVTSGVVIAEVHPWHPSVPGYVDKKPW